MTNSETRPSSPCSSTTPILPIAALEQEKIIRGLEREGLYGRQRTIPYRHGPLRRPCVAGRHAIGTVRYHVLMGTSVSVPKPTGDRAVWRGGPQY